MEEADQLGKYGEGQGAKMEEDRGSELYEYIDPEEVVPVVEDDIDPTERMDSSNFAGLRERECTTRSVATLHATDGKMGCPRRWRW